MILEIQRKLKNREITCEELIKTHLDVISSQDLDINAFITKTPETAIDAAKHVDEEIRASKDLDELFKNRPLLGIPLAHKDIFSTKDIKTTAASKILEDYIPVYDATVVSKLKKSGGISLGKLNCDAFAHGATGENSDFGPTKNPYDKSRVSGGSSSGTAASVASKMVVFATGTDTGGSLRNPASFTNTVAIKPTYGRVSRYGIIAMASSLDSVGHITTSVEDSALILSQTAGFDKYDATTSKNPVENYLENIGADINGKKIGIVKEYLSDEIDSEISEKTKSAINIFEKLGAEIIDISLPNSEYALASYYVITPSEVSSNLARFDGIRFGNTRDKFGDEAKRRIMLGTYALSAGFYDGLYLKAQKVRTLIIQDFKKAFSKVDAILAPVSPVMPPKIGEVVSDPMKNYLMDILTVPVNLAGLPALSIPCGFSKGGLPIGIQLIGDHFLEKNLYNLGYNFERASE
ncbi:Asp-tRNA(Asn)/Glu-tRNA(Gln) amidotransferase GatCAB subunit A [candidate division WWE3 bacterium CG_4_9_14_0_2_um_filter_35_11]|uniref:Glutamyl-tRNA(Gln) amidotransferase subunit A n=1 Tax=candidate division WWE3 bacterium CG_4_9_14_0_2_um_filter_35_11 TaxID=1975077 RepID=A0A2M8EKU5_UNCKA|nr:MAG: Asp-tRNA(Asn)/Glu-tRNA(Gln) amidotransferase GatCAB subunit A [candidate division WWE3 bacterium CG10_big_fil_rev_8_21_14_0_10_35_32]PJC23317.1 MAG: Asp-tRNA(Asn)/Glu-tRNA(Gln) amidotransferase GatCAB subunit A [candidate division WWE3 bacterium CG_4_9_14_0_2_um_filter_35_11]